MPGASVTFTPINPAGVAGRPALAFTRGGRPEEYGADLTVRQAGSWRYRIHVSSSLGKSETEVSLEVRGPPEQPGLGPGIIFFGVVAAIAGGIAYLVVQAQKRPAGH